jgi:predicted Fe-Mo cluster-binding NifX family protein
MLTMKVAIAHWENRISPVFDVSDRLLLVEIVNGKEVNRLDIVLTCHGPIERAREVYHLGTQVLLCGAISRPMETALSTAGVQVIGFICGDLEDIFNAFICGRITDKCYKMPGCNENRAQDEISS